MFVETRELIVIRGGTLINPTASEPGKLADLVLLDADPLADIRNARNIFKVVKGGVVKDQATLLCGL